MTKRFLILLFIPSLIWAQLGALHLIIEPSPSFKGMGGIGVGLPSNDPTATYYNPANGLLNRDKSITITRVHIPYHFGGDQILNYTYHMIGLTAFGQNSPIQVAVGYHGTLMETIPPPPLPYSSYVDKPLYSMMEHGPTFAIGYRDKLLILPFSASIGLAWKSGTLSFLDYQLSGKFTFADIGVMLSFPLQLNLPIGNGFLVFKPAVGYSLTNTGFTDHPSPNDVPSPRAGRLGISLSGGANNSRNRELFSFKYGRSVLDYFALMGEQVHSGAIAYQSGLGDIDIKKNLIEGKGDENVTFQEGFEIGILGIASTRRGISTIPGEDGFVRSTGFTIHLNTILFELGRFFSIRPMYTFGKNFDLQYDYASRESTGNMPLSDQASHLITLGLKDLW